MILSGQILGYDTLHQVPQQRRKPDVPKRQFTEINMSLAQTLQHPLKIELITLRDPPKSANTSTPDYKLNTRCAYHSHIPGHYQNNCWTLKNKIQDLINDGEIKFNPLETPVVITAPMPSLDGRTFGSLDLLSFACFFSVCLNIQIMIDIICFNNHHQCIAYVCLE